MHNTRQFPAEIHGVLDADVHALTAHRRVDMGGIAGEENPPFPVVLGEARFIREARHPDRIARTEIPAGNAGRSKPRRSASDTGSESAR